MCLCLASRYQRIDFNLDPSLIHVPFASNEELSRVNLWDLELFMLYLLRILVAERQHLLRKQVHLLHIVLLAVLLRNVSHCLYGWPSEVGELPWVLQGLHVGWVEEIRVEVDSYFVTEVSLGTDVGLLLFEECLLRLVSAVGCADIDITSFICFRLNKARRLRWAFDVDKLPPNWKQICHHFIRGLEILFDMRRGILL